MILPFLLAVGCAPPGPVVGTTEAPTIATTAGARVDLDGVLPTDLLPAPDGGVWVLDGYAGRVLGFGPDGAARGVWAGEGLGRPVRLAAARDGGAWATVPGLDGDAGLLVHLGADGGVVDVLAPRVTDGVELHPVDVVDLPTGLVVADRDGRVAWVDPTTGTTTRILVDRTAGDPLRRVVDLAEDGGGGLVAVDALASRVDMISADGAVTGGFGDNGLNVGQLARPTSVAVTADGAFLVADSVLGAIQAFERDGDVIGVLADADGPLRLDHPVAVRILAASPLTLAVLEASPPRLRLLTVDRPLPPAPPPALLHTRLSSADADPAGESGASCLQCHDGLVLDSREVWDPARTHHPVGIVPERPLPEVFALDEAGRMVCTTCHSPHGVVDTSDGAPDVLVRHRSESSPFTRLEKDADALCFACHGDDAHVNSGAATLSPRVAGHPTGPALIAALRARGATADGPSDPTRASCLSCHAMHGATGEAITRDPGDGATCLGCHPSVARPTTNHPLGRVPGSDLLANHHDRRVELSADGGIGCLTCHDLEGNRGAELVRTLAGGGAVCLDCHTARTDLGGGAHARLASGGLPTCVACHDVHGGARDAHFLTPDAPTAGDPAGCLDCHGPGRRAAPAGGSPGRVGHPVDGAAVAANDPLTCLSCHDPHAADPPGASTCTSCHAEQAEAAAHGGHGSATCVDCHPAHHAAPRASGDLNPASARCLACHGEGSTVAAAPRVADYEHPEPAFLPDGRRWSPLGGLVLYGPDGTPQSGNQNGDLSCGSCHLVHGPNAKGDPDLRRDGSWQSACASCHGDDALALYKYFHQPERRKDVRGEAP